MLNFKKQSDLDLQVKFVGIVESLQAVHKFLLILLLAVLVGALPVGFALREVFFRLTFMEPGLIVYEEPDPRDIEVVDKQIIKVGPETYVAYARISNPNHDLAVRNLAVFFQLKDSSGGVVAEYKEASYILPGEDKLLLMPVREFTTPPQSVSLTLTAERWIRPGNVQDINFIVERPNFGPEPSGAFVVSALLRNESPYIFPEVEISVILYDLQRRVVGVNVTTINDLQRNEHRFFRLIWPSGVSGQVVNVDIKPVVNQLKRGTLITEPAGTRDPREYEGLE